MAEPRLPSPEVAGPPGYTIRRLRPEDAPDVGRLALRVLGEAYPRAALRDPEAVARLNRTGAWISAVAQTPEGAIVGHAALERHPRGPIAELGLAAVAPDHRRHGLLAGLRDFLLGEAERRGLRGWFVDLDPTGSAAEGHVRRAPTWPCAVVLGLWPGPAAQGASPVGRRSFVRHHRYLRPPARVASELPGPHRELVARLYAERGARLELVSEARPRGAGASLVVPHPDVGTVTLVVERVGDDSVARLAAAAQELVSAPGAEALYLELPLGQPGVAALCREAERLGFGFGGVLPDALVSGDALLLQRVLHDLRPIAGPTGHPLVEALLAHVLAEQARTRREL